MSERLYTQLELDLMIEKANQDGLQSGAQYSDDAYREGFIAGYAVAVNDHETGEFHDPVYHLGNL